MGFRPRLFCMGNCWQLCTRRRVSPAAGMIALSGLGLPTLRPSHSPGRQHSAPQLAKLRGRCRDCGGPISSRDFFVELTLWIGLSFWRPSITCLLRDVFRRRKRETCAMCAVSCGLVDVTLVTTLIAAMLTGQETRVCPLCSCAGNDRWHCVAAARPSIRPAPACRIRPRKRLARRLS